MEAPPRQRNPALGEGKCLGIALGGQAINRRPTRIAQPQQPRHLIKRLPRRIIAGLPHQLIVPTAAHGDRTRVPPRYQQAQERRLQFGIC